jgi:hypothetical protein
MERPSASSERTAETLNRFEYNIALFFAVIAGLAYCAATAMAMAWRKAKSDFQLRKHFLRMRMPQLIHQSKRSRSTKRPSFVRGNAAATFTLSDEMDEPR